MIDLYADDVSLVDIQQKDKQVLKFVNKKKDETVFIPVTDEELVNIYNRVKMRCETMKLIPIRN